MNEDPRCCGSGTCIIDNEGRCWCGQQWDGERMCQVPLASLQAKGPPTEPAPAVQATGNAVSLPSLKP